LKIDIAAKRRKKHKNKISGFVNSVCYNEQKSEFRLYTDSSKRIPGHIALITDGCQAKWLLNSIHFAKMGDCWQFTAGSFLDPEKESISISSASKEKN
jgi:hypothetical protein